MGTDVDLFMDLTTREMYVRQFGPMSPVFYIR